MVKAAIAVAACAVAAAVFAAAPPAARADGDPASDMLLIQNVFYPFSPPVAPAIQRTLNAETAAAKRAHFPIKVALIASPADLGAVPSLFAKPQQYADFLDQEISFFGGKQPLLVVMPNGYGVQGLTPSGTVAASSCRHPPAAPATISPAPRSWRFQARRGRRPSGRWGPRCVQRRRRRLGLGRRCGCRRRRGARVRRRARERSGSVVPTSPRTRPVIAITPAGTDAGRNGSGSARSASGLAETGPAGSHPAGCREERGPVKPVTRPESSGRVGACARGRRGSRSRRSAVLDGECADRERPASAQRDHPGGAVDERAPNGQIDRATT